MESCKTANMPGNGGGSLFLKTHPKSKHLWDRALNPDSTLNSAVYVFDINTLEFKKKLRCLKERMAGWYTWNTM